MPELTSAERIMRELIIRVNMAVRRGTELYNEMSAWRASQPLQTIVRVKPDGMGWVVEVTKLDPAPSLEEWGIQFGELAHHFRSVLNTMLTRIAEVEGIPITPRLQFPITQEHSKWVGKRKNQGERDRLKGFPNRIVRAIYGIQPFVMSRQHGKPPMYDVLAVLAWTNNQDKHHLELKGNLTPYTFHHDFTPVFTEPSANVVGAVDVRYIYDYSLELGSSLVDADTSPFVVQEMGRSEYDLIMEVGVLDEAGEMTPVRLVMEEFREKVLHIIELVLNIWKDPTFDVDMLAGSSDSQRGAAFGKAAVDSVAGRQLWDKDFNRSQRGRDARLRSSLENVFGIPDLGPPPSEAPEA